MAIQPYMHHLKLNLKTSKVWGSDLNGTSNEYMTWDSMVWDDATSFSWGTAQIVYSADLKK